MVKQDEDGWGVFGKMSVERLSFYGWIEAIVVSCVGIAMLRSRSRMVEDRLYRQSTLQTRSTYFSLT